jgi:hypothetical protein
LNKIPQHGSVASKASDSSTDQMEFLSQQQIAILQQQVVVMALKTPKMKETFKETA